MTGIGEAGALAAASLPATIMANDGTTAQAQLLAVQASGGVLYVPPGDYSALPELVTSEAYKQPIIRGGGKLNTIGLKLKFVGGSGQLSGGYIGDLGAQITLAGCCGVDIERVEFSGAGLLFHNEAASSFTEFCVARNCDFPSTIARHIEYKVTAGSASFHGTGFRDCVFTQPSSASGPIIKIGTGCRVYQAPFDGTFFPNTPGQALVLNSGGATMEPITTGTIRVEGAGIFLDAASVSPVYHAGAVQLMGENMVMGTGFVLADLLQRNTDGTSNILTLQQRQVALTNAASPGTAITDTLQDGQWTVTLYIRANNYDYRYHLHVDRSPYDGSGTVTVLANTMANNTAGWGAPTIAVSGNKLYVLNTNFTGSVTCYMTIRALTTRVTNFPH